MSRKYDRCPNCLTFLKPSDQYCPYCGQENENKIVSFKTLVLDFLGDYFTFDSKFFTSLTPLLFKPGVMTYDYLSGRRERYIPPLRMLIFSSVLYLLLLSFHISRIDLYDKEFIQIGDGIEGEAQDSLAASMVDTMKLGVLTFTDSRDTGLVADSAGFNFFAELNRLAREYEPDAVTDSILLQMEAKEIGSDGFRKKWYTGLIIRQMAKIVSGQGDDYFKFIIGNGTLAILLISPLFALLLKLVYIRRKKLFMYHYIFSLHFHTFVIVLLFAAHLIYWLFDYFPLLWFVLIAMVYLFFALKNVYRQGWGRTLLKEMIVGGIYLIFAMPAFFTLLMFISFLLF